MRFDVCVCGSIMASSAFHSAEVFSSGESQLIQSPLVEPLNLTVPSVILQHRTDNILCIMNAVITLSV